MSVAVWEAMKQHPLRFLTSSWPLRCWAFLFGGMVLGLAVLVSFAALLFFGVMLSVVGVGLVVLTLTTVFGLPVANMERRRLRLVEPVPPPDPHSSLAGVSARAWLRTRLRERATWRELGYAVILAVFFTGANTGFVVLLGLSGMLLATPVVVWALAPETVMIIPGHAIPGPTSALPFCALGLLGLVLCAYGAALLAAAQVKTALFLLSPRDEPSQSRVIELTRSRIRLADAFEAERRRIERDLHDGAQQQLVVLTMTLGLAQMEMGESASPAAALVSRARGEARQALDDLRRLVRGIHPQVLTDHGLAAAVAEVALGHLLPVTVDIDLPHRLPGAVETTAYFTVTEALTNAAKHSGASRVAVVGRYKNDRLILLITDDGHGGADPAGGTGLSGLADRMAILKGRLVVSSPRGGPTQLRVEVPCSG
ncbi:sensor histidine kinase [Streptomyces sp. ISL-100]|uniref:sensor histidine kinase n=1 Tax=Streptomyces sp. ISL-100 TaxID=2819173 RepID=UPI001BE51839|nr:sensor histidine kinase [Streptomyces sp. ISL-100]MBT2400160.1 sensor domain-containing protein [Streptomyces sp. ISL-100]